MINLNALRTPYDNIRPKSFFAERKNMINGDILASESGKTFNPSWNMNKKASNKPIKAQNADLSELKVILPWALFLTMAIANILISL